MAYRPLFKPYNVIPNAGANPANTGSMASSITSVPTIIQQLSMINYQAVWSGTTPVGTASIQCSDDYNLNADGTVQNAGTWSTIPFTDTSSGTTVTSLPVTGNTGSGVFDIPAIGAYALRFVYTATSGTGTLQVKITAKVA